MKTLRELPSDLSGKKILVRMDYDVPITDGAVNEEDAMRINASIQTIDYLMALGGQIILVSHVGRKGESLEPIAHYLNTKRSCFFVRDILGQEAQNAIASMTDTDIVLLENLRTNPGEEGNDPEFAKALAGYADYYINESFAVSHRNHASIVGIPKILPSYAGLQFQAECEALSKLKNPEPPFVLIMGGAKFETKLPVMEQFLDKAQTIIVGGALVNTLLQKRGFSVGISLIDTTADVTRLLKAPNIFLPDRVIVERHGAGVDIPVTEILQGDNVVDLSPQSLQRFQKTIADAKTIIWNGPLGLYERGYTKSSEKIIELIQGSKAFSVVGGGDTVAMITQKNLTSSFSFVSTAGGAMLEFLAKGTLSGIEALK